MADAWDEYLKRAQSGGDVFGSLSGGLTPNKQGLYTPGLRMPPVGPATPINYGAIRNLLSSGVLRTGQVAAPEPAALAAPEPAAPPQRSNPLALLFSLFGGLGK
jgi:hypothetical protein